MLQYEFIDNFFIHIREDINVYSYLYMGVQFLAASFLLLNLYYSYLENKLSWKSILQTLTYVLIALQFADIAQMLDSLMASYVESITFFTSDEQGLNAAIGKLYEDIDLANPWSIGDLLASGIIVVIIYIIYGLSWLIKVIGLPFFLLSRGFFLLAIYLFTPIVVALSIIEQYRSLVINIIKLFCSVYILQYLYMLVDFILAAFVVYATEELKAETSGLLGDSSATSISLMIVVILVSFCSVKLYSSSSTISSKIFNV